MTTCPTLRLRSSLTALLVPMLGVLSFNLARADQPAQVTAPNATPPAAAAIPAPASVSTFPDVPAEPAIPNAASAPVQPAIPATSAIPGELGAAAAPQVFATQVAAPAPPIPAGSSANAWQEYNWLAPTRDAQQTVAGGTLHATAGQQINDPFSTVQSGSLYRESYGAIYSHPIGDGLSVSCESDAVVLSDDSQQLSNGQKVGLQFQPAEELTFRGDVHDSSNDATLASDSTITTGASLTTEAHLPCKAILTLGLTEDRTGTDVPSGLEARTSAYDAQWTQPLGSLPFSAVLKGHYEGTATGTADPTSLPSLEQSLIWKPLQATTIQAGLRQQQYQEYPGVDHQLNEALFADWSQKVIDNVSWHSYAEVLNSKGLLDQAPASPLATGANGTPQATTPGSNASLTSSLPLTIDDQTLTFSTGPSFKLQKDISASVEYSDRWDRNPSPGGIGQEQRVSVSLKGTF